MNSNFTGFWGQVNNASQDTLEVAFAFANCLVLLVTLHVGILANFFVTWAVYRQKSLQTSNNALLVNLAVIDILRCAVDCPFLLAIVLSVRNASDLGIVFCSAQIASFSLICCVQLFTLACISAERYQAVAHPFRNAERRKRITVSIMLTWVVPVSISVLCVIFAKDSPVYVRCRGLRVETLDSYDTFGFYILTPVWCVCLTVIVGFYARIFLLVRAHSRKIFDQGSCPPPDKKEDKTKQKDEETKTNSKIEQEKHVDLKPHEREPEMKAEHFHTGFARTETSIDPSDMNKLDCEFEKSKETKVTFIDELPNEASEIIDPEGLVNLQENAAETSPSPTNGKDDTVSFKNADGDVSGTSTNEESDIKSKKHKNTAAETSLSNAEGDADPAGKTPSPTHEEEGDTADTPEHQNPSIESSQSSLNEGAVDSNAPQETAETSPASNADAQIVTAPQQEDMAGAVCLMPSPAQRERGNAKKESKLAKRSGYIIFTFLIFWIPLIATVVLNQFFYQNNNHTAKVSRQLEILTVSVVCMTSFTNPIIYAAVNPQFRTEFYNLKTKWKAFFTSS
ncbi:parietopsin isoform X1 [Triplophysa dalaica]|uniref:parietopsin isoform X1 n=1 Tax=Triplophysa dalaica TaxID=1582913 RepID=UPI0024DFC45B|nr:parietopsin isoform X1 [Triplophysa dalaica]